MVREIATNDLCCCLLPRCEALLLEFSDRNTYITQGSAGACTETLSRQMKFVFIEGRSCKVCF